MSQNAHKPVAPDTPPVAPVAMEVEILRDYWPKNRPANLSADEEHRVRRGEFVSLPQDEAFDVCEAGIGKRARREDAAR